MFKKQVSVGRALLCVLLCVVFTAVTTYQFVYYTVFSSYRQELADKTASMQANENAMTQLRNELAETIAAKDALLAQREAELTAALNAAEDKVRALTSRIVQLAGKSDATPEECLRFLVGKSLAKKHSATGVSKEHLNEEVDAYMDNYADNYLAIVERLLFVDYLYRFHYVGDAPSADEMQEAILEGYIAAAGDVYAKYFTPEEYEKYRNQLNSTVYGVGTVTTPSPDGKAIVVLHAHSGSPAAKAGLQTGDLITAVGGISVADIGYNAALALVGGEEGTKVTLSVHRGNNSFFVTLSREKVESDVVIYRSYEENGKRIGYIRIVNFTAATARRLQAAYTDLKDNHGVEALVFDVRDNTGGLLSSIIEVLDFILPKGTPLLRYDFKNPNAQMEPEYAKSEHFINMPMYVLQNGNTASAAELFAATLSDSGVATLIGETTYGKGQLQTGYRMPDGSYIAVSVAHYSAPVSGNYEGVGIEPDLPCTPAAGYEDALIYLLPIDKDIPLQTALAAAAGEN